MKDKGQKLAHYISTLDDFQLTPKKPPSPAYQHMGAITVDTILQAGMSYQHVVWPRVKWVIDKYPHAQTTSTFQRVIEEDGIFVVMKWKHPEKPRRLHSMLSLFMSYQVETVSDLQEWLLVEEHCLMLLNIKGIGNKTLDYIKNLAGLSSVAVDRHVINFVQSAGIHCSTYSEYRDTVKQAADTLNVQYYALDKAIWRFCAITLKTIPNDQRLMA